MAFQEFTGDLDPTTYNDPRLDDYARKAATARGIDPDILLSIKNQGERSNPTAVSPKGAAGVMQMMPGTWKAYGKGDPKDPYASIDAAAEFISKELNPKYQGNKAAILAHYNGGVSQGQAVASGGNPTFGETQSYLQRTGAKGGFAPFTGTLDSEAKSPTPTFQDFNGELDQPETPKQQPVSQPTQVAQPKPQEQQQSWDGFGGYANWLGSELKRAANNPKEFAKETASAGAKLADLALTPLTAAAGYLAGGTMGVLSGDSKIAKSVKDKVIDAFSIDKALQANDLAKDTPEVTGQVLDTVLGKPAKVIADATTPEGTIWHDLATDASMALLAGGGAKATKVAADRAVKTPEVRPSAPEPVEPMRPQVQGELDLGVPAQQGPVQPGAGLVKNTEPPQAMQDLIGQARYDLVKQDFQDAGKELRGFDAAVEKTRQEELNRPQTQYQLFDGLLDQVPNDYPGPRVTTKTGVELMDTRGTGERFHGSSTPFEKLSDDYALQGDNRNIYGQGFYTTDAADIAHGYMSKGKGGQPVLYSVKETGNPKLYNMEEPLTPELHKLAEDTFGDLYDTYSKDTGEPITNLRELYDEVRQQSRYEGYTRDDVQGMFDSFRDQLEQMGYSGFSHKGGLRTNNPAHTVNIYWTPEKHLTLEKGDIRKYWLQPKIGKYDIDAANQAYPNQNPRLPEVTPETVDPRVMEQQQLFTQPLHGLIQDAAASAEPKPYRELTPEEAAQIRMDKRIEAAREEPIDLPGRKQSQMPLDLDTPDQLSYQLDRAAEDIQGRGTSSQPGVSNLGLPTKEDFQTKKDLPMIMSPQKVVDIMGVDASNLKSPPGELVRSVSPNWAKRDTWNNHPILRSTFDNLNYLRDERNAWLKDLIDPKTDENGVTRNPTQYLDALDNTERREQAHYTIKYEGEKTPAMAAEGRNFFNYDEWRERGASDRVAKALVEGSEIYQKALEKYNNEAKMLGERPIEVIPNYFPHRHYGDFFATITDKRNGQKEIFPFQSLKDARKAAEAMKGQIPDTHTIDYGRKERGGNDFRDLMDALRTRSESFHGTNPNGFTTMLDTMRKSMDEAFFAGTERRSGKGHYTGEQGYDLNADKKTQKAQREEVKFVTDSPRTYAQNMADYVMDRKVQALKDAYQKAAEQNGFSHTGAWQDTKKVINKQASLYTEPVFDSSKSTFIEDAADSVAKIMDRGSTITGHSPVSWLGRRAVVARMHNMNRIATTLLLHPMTNSALTISQFGQFLTSPINVVSQISRAVGKNAPESGFIGQLKQTGKTPAVIGEAFTRGVWDAIAPIKMRSESGRQALQWAKQHGHLDTMLSHEHLDTMGKAKRLAKLEDVTIASEQIPRGMTYLAGYHAFRRLGFTDGAAKRAAVEFSNTVMGDYTKEGKIEFIRDQTPLVGTAISPFSTWLWNSKAQVAALGTGLGGHGAKSFMAGTVVPLAALAGATYMFTGWSGMPGVQDYDNLMKWLNETFNMENPTSAQLHMEHGTDVFGKEANAAYYGKLAEATGRDTGKSIRYGSIVDFGAPGASYGLQAGKAAYQLGKKGLSELGLVETPTDMDLYKATKGATPPGLKTFTEDYFAKKKENGDMILKSGIKRKEGETSKSFWLAFNDLDEKKQQDVNNTANYIKARQNKMADRQLELIKDKALRGDDVSQNFRQLVDLNPDYAKHPVSVVQSVVQEAMKRQLTQAEFEQLKAALNSSLNDKQDAARRKQYLEKMLNAK